METPSDSELMSRIAGGDTAQLAHLFERHHLSLYRYLLRLTGSPAQSEDLVQEAFLRALKHAATYKPQLSFSVWLFGIARNAWFDLLRKRRSELPGLDFDDFRSTEPMLEEVLTRREDVQFLGEALGQLSEPKREVLVLSRFHNMRYEEIARLMQCEVSTIKVRVYRALKELRERFAELRGEQVYDA